MDLEEIQDHLLGELLNIKKGGERQDIPGDRISIYKNNIITTTHENLISIYPSINNIIGKTL